MKEIIFLSMHLPCSLVPEAGQKLAHDRLFKYIEDGVKVHLISFVNEREVAYLDVKLYERCKSVNFFKIKKYNRLFNFIKDIRIPLPLAVRNDYRISKCIRDILRKNDIHEFHIEYEQGALFVPFNLLGKTTVVFHDVISQGIGRLRDTGKNSFLKWLYDIQFKMMIRWEKRILEGLKSIVVLNQKDKALILNFNSNLENVTIDYPKVSDLFLKINRDHFRRANLIFWGAMNRKENIDAVIWFSSVIFPRVLKEVPDATFTIVGANPSDSVKNLACHNITVTGFVEDPTSFFECAQVSVVPLRYGAGIKIKVLETLAARIPTVSTTIGAEGISDNQNLLYVTDDEEIFSREVIDLIKCEN
ncbi:glycosyltransferase [Serratia fonticola]|jgi:glycosyltransferase involved in cell wall biosynthesis|uniref:glycosyltransferase n=1 Tax=Serratia fonticola TaxID=47917 RepID=UPI001415324A|nr:glycosyltransferase [Serratia fonticola]NXZ86157.1 glycosyltransferase [Serratia fonticola]QIP93625.1 hypothetical protein HAP32_04145 [Serratia fonticola]